MRKVAVLLSGGVNAGSNYSRYLNDLREMYRTLVQKHGYAKTDIFVLYADGVASDLDGDGANDVHGACTRAKLNELFQTTLPPRLTANDLLFIFSTNHGGLTDAANKRSKLWLWAGSIEDTDFAVLVNGLQFKYLVVCMEQCYSGGFVDNLAGTNRIIATACRHDEVSWACDSEGNYDEFCYYWTAAVRGAKPNGQTVSADMDGDGYVSLRDAFTYAETNDSRSEHPQYAEAPSGIGRYMTLSGPIAWHYNKPVLRTHAKHDSQMAWAYLGDMGSAGWLRVRPKATDGTTNNFMMLCEALANGRRVDAYIQDGMIEQVTVR